MTETITKEATFIPLERIRFSDARFYFRFEDAERKLALKEDLLKHGQIYPLTLLEIENSEFVILDGHERFRIIQEIHSSESRWESVVANTHLHSELSVKDQFTLLCQANLTGPYAFGLIEKGRFFSYFQDQGLTKLQMAELAGMTLNDTDELITLTETPPEIEELINQSLLPSYFALQLVKSVFAWKGTSFEPASFKFVQEIISYYQPTISPHDWQFYLDFYLGKPRPFRGLKKNLP